jgi:chromosome segregation ATPase
MSSLQPAEAVGAEARFRQAFERLKDGNPRVVVPGTPVTQNNVAREASCDPSALKKARFPELVREIQAYVELHNAEDQSAARKAKKQKAAKRSLEERLEDALRQRDQVQSVLASANVRIVELTDEVRSLQRRLDELQPPPTKLGRR